MSRQIEKEGLTFDDVLMLPAHSTVLPKDVSLQTKIARGIALNIPILSAAMDTVTESRLAIALAQEGGIGFIHKNMTVEQQAGEVRKVKKFESGVIQDPITVSPDVSVYELLEITHANNISGVPVVDNGQLVGIVTSRDILFETRMDLAVAQVMTPKQDLVTVLEGSPREKVIKLLHKHRIEKVLVVNDQFQLRGLITVKDILKAKEKPDACKDSSEQLCVGGAVGVGAKSYDRIEALVDAGVDVLVVDTAHGHSQHVLDQVRWIKKRHQHIPVIGGNIATKQAAIDLVKAGVDGVKVGIGPGSICTTRIVTGVGVPQITAIMDVAAGLKGTDVSLIADGGIRFTGDICKAIAAGASGVMIGSLFAGTDESPGEIELYQGRTYKNYRGMGSIGAMSQIQGSSDRYFQEFDNQVEKLVPEGIEGRVPYKGSMQTVVQQFIGGLRSSMGYTGCATIDELKTQVKFLKVTHAGHQESHVHDVSIVKQAPNYQID